MRVGTIYEQQICDTYIQNVICPHCEDTVPAQMNRSVQTGTILFIPFFKCTVLYYTTCMNCNKKYILSKRKYKEILNSVSKSDEWNRVTKCDFEKEKAKSSEDIIRSPKRTSIASLLALIFGLCGMQNLYMGRKKSFLVNISMVGLALISIALSTATTEAFFSGIFGVALATNVYGGIIDFFRILTGHAKDSEGRYLLTNRQYRKRLSVHSQLHDKTYNYE